MPVQIINQKNSHAADHHHTKPVSQTSSLRLLSIRQAAGYAAVSQSTIRRMIKTGLKTYRAGRQIRINEADLIAHISTN